MEEAALKGKRVLLVEDDESNQRMTSIVLQHFGCKVDTASDGLQVLPMMKKIDYDIVLLDIRLPGKSGYEIVKEIRDDISKDIPVIAVTAHAMEEEYERCLEAGMNDRLTKPFELNDLKKIILKWIS